MKSCPQLRGSALVALLAAAALGAWAPRACAEEPSPEPYFYKGYRYGTQAVYNPLWVFLNRSFDVLQMHLNSRNLFTLSYGTDARNVAENVFAHPLQSISEQGWRRFFTNEILPLSFTRHTARWAPNYSLHLIAGGMTFTALREWSAAQGLSKPVGVLIAAGTVLGSAFVNETLENGGVVGRNTDAVADFWFFDIGGILLFSFDSVNRFFSKELIIADWSLQPSFTLPSGELHNQGNYFSAKWPIPFHTPLRAFIHFGMGTMFGLSYKFDSQYSVSAAAGYKITRLRNKETQSVENTVEFAPSAGLFVDRNNSLLGSVHVSDIQDYFVQFNLYPQRFFRINPGIGLWGVASYTGGVAAGLSFTHTLGVGAGYAAL